MVLAGELEEPVGQRPGIAVVAAVGFVAVALVPFLKYPATPPAVGSAETIGDRTGYYFAFQLVSLVVAVANPFDRELFENVKRLTGQSVERLLVDSV